MADTKNVPVPQVDRDRFCIDGRRGARSLPTTPSRSRTITQRSAGHPMPMDIEWAKDADDGQLYVIQARPETVASRKEPTASRPIHLKEAALGVGHGSGGRREDRGRACTRHCRCARLAAVPARRSSGRGIDQPGLGAGHEDRGRDRDGARRADLPCRHCCARARRSGRCRSDRSEGSAERRARS